MADSTSTTLVTTELAQFLGASLTAIVEADAMAADTFRRFLEEVAFDNSEDPSDLAVETAAVTEARALLGDNGRKLGRLRYVSFSYDHIRNGERVTSVIKLPLISLLPLPAMQVREATVDFDVRIVATKGSRALPPLRSSAARPPPPPSVLVAPARAANTKDHSAIMKVHVLMESADMPMGLATLLNLTSQGVSGATVAQTPTASDNTSTPTPDSSTRR